MASGQGKVDAIEVLEADHKLIEKLFAEYAEMVRHEAGRPHRRELAERICTELIIHTRLEEELFHPHARAALRDDDLLEANEEQHENVRDLVAQLLAMKAGHELHDARMALLRDYVTRHMQQEHWQLFARVKASGADLALLGERLVQRKRELQVVAEALREDALASALA